MALRLETVAAARLQSAGPNGSAPPAVLSLLVQLLAVQHQHAAAVPQAAKHLLAADAPQLLLLAAAVLRLHQPQPLSVLLSNQLQLHQLRSSFVPPREHSTACDPLDCKPFCIGEASERGELSEQN